MKLLALIPARGGSKRIPNKNMRWLGGKPLISWTIEIAKQIPEFADILVSTDSEAIAQYAKKQGTLVPWLRPTELSSDVANSIDVCLHAIDWYEKENGKIDGVMLLQPTSPFRSTFNLKRSIELFKTQPQKSVVSFSTAASHPMWCYRINDHSLIPYIEFTAKMARSQDLPAAYVPNGSIYLANTDYLRRWKSFIGKETNPIIIDEYSENIDIDTEDDWKLAEYILGKLQSEKKNKP